MQLVDFSKWVPQNQKIKLNILGWFALIVFFCQVYDENDYRRARFVGREKEVSYLRKVEKMYVHESQNISSRSVPFSAPVKWKCLGRQFKPLCWISVVVSYWSHTVCVKVNKNFAINLVAEEPVTDVESRVVSCDGGGGALGHPKVYINLVMPTAWINSLKWCKCQFLFEPMCFLFSLLPEEITW